MWRLPGCLHAKILIWLTSIMCRNYQKNCLFSLSSPVYLLVVALLLLIGCGGSSNSSDPAPAETTGNLLATLPLSQRLSEVNAASWADVTAEISVDGGAPVAMPVNNNIASVQLKELDLGEHALLVTFYLSGSSYERVPIAQLSKTIIIEKGNNSLSDIVVADFDYASVDDDDDGVSNLDEIQQGSFFAVNNFNIKVAVTGLSGSLILQNNEADDLSVSENGEFSFNETLPEGNSYSVSVLAQPAAQTCSLNNASGQSTKTVLVEVNCSDNPPRYIGGSVAGLIGMLVLGNNNNDVLRIINNGSFQFDSTVDDNTDYSVSVLNQPTAQTCTVSEGTGVAHADINQIALSCSGGHLRGLNDSGITFSGEPLSPYGNNDDCSASTSTKQDCGHAGSRDLADNNNNDGHAGFSFTKIAVDGQVMLVQNMDWDEGVSGEQSDLEASGVSWSCVKDNISGFVWSVQKQLNDVVGDGGLLDADDTFSWYRSDSQSNGGSVGYVNSSTDSCAGYSAGEAASYCNIEAYVARVNEQTYCGYSDWRLPTVSELENLVNLDRSDPAIDTVYFPETKVAYYWSVSPHAKYDDFAWAVNFADGNSIYRNRDNAYYVRLVRGE